MWQCDAGPYDTLITLWIYNASVANEYYFKVILKLNSIIELKSVSFLYFSNEIRMEFVNQSHAINA